MTDIKHTPLPWKNEDGDIFVETNDDYGMKRIALTAKGLFGETMNMSDEEHEANAALIVKACNSHYELLEALKCAQALDLPYQEGLNILVDAGFANEGRFELSASKFVSQKIDAAIAKAEGK